MAGRIKGERKIVKPFNCCIIGTLCSLGYYFGAFHVSVFTGRVFLPRAPKSLPLRPLSSPQQGGNQTPLAQAVVWLCLQASLRESSSQPFHLGRRGPYGPVHVWSHSHPIPRTTGDAYAQGTRHAPVCLRPSTLFPAQWALPARTPAQHTDTWAPRARLCPLLWRPGRLGPTPGSTSASWGSQGK